MSTQLLEPPVRIWKCPSCGNTDRTQEAGVISRMHPCKSLHGINLPMVEVKTEDAKPDAKHLLVEREDYTYNPNDGKIAAVNTLYGDGHNDCTVLAPVARGRGTAFPPGGINRSAPPGGSLVVTPGTAGVEVRNHHQFFDPRIAKIARIAGYESWMAWSASKVFAFAQLQMAKAVLNLSTDSYKVALYVAAMTPDNTVTTAALTEYNGAASQWVVANEVSSTNYTAGGTAVSSPTITQVTNVVTFTSAGTPSWTTVTFSTSGCLVYDTTVSNEGLCYNYFGGSQSVTAGNFSISWNASGIANWTC